MKKHLLPKRKAVKTNTTIQNTTVDSLYDYGWLVYAVMNVLDCEDYYAEALIKQNGYSTYAVESWNWSLVFQYIDVQQLIKDK